MWIILNERKKCNIVVKGVQELSSVDKKLNIRSDIEFLDGTCEIPENDSCFRTGKPVVSSHGNDVPCPLVAKLKSKENALQHTQW